VLDEPPDLAPFARSDNDNASRHSCFLSNSRRQVDRYARFFVADSIGDEDNEDEQAVIMRQHTVCVPALQLYVDVYEELYMSEVDSRARAIDTSMSVLRYISEPGSMPERAQRSIIALLIILDTLFYLYVEFGVIFDDLVPRTDIHLYWRPHPDRNCPRPADWFGFNRDVVNRYQLPTQHARQVRAVVTSTRGNQAQKWPSHRSTACVLTNETYERYGNTPLHHLVRSLFHVVQSMPSFDVATGSFTRQVRDYMTNLHRSPQLPTDLTVGCIATHIGSLWHSTVVVQAGGLDHINVVDVDFNWNMIPPAAAHVATA